MRIAFGLMFFVLLASNVLSQDSTTDLRRDRASVIRPVPTGIAPWFRPEKSSKIQQRYSRVLDLVRGVMIGPEAAESKENFFVAFLNGGEVINARWSRNGQSWESGNFPASATSPGAPANVTAGFGGVGASADPLGIIHNVIFDQPFGYMDVWGLGPTIWDATGYSRSLMGQPASAPSAVDLGGGRRLIVVVVQGSVNINLYDHNSRSIIAIIPLPGQLNSGVTRRPQIVRRDDGQILVAWVAGVTVFAAVGEISSLGLPAFNAPIQVPLSSSGLQAAASSQIGLAADDKYFYLAVVQRDASTGSGAGDPLLGYQIAIYRSTDGMGWSLFDTVVQDVKLHSKVQIAAKSNGTILLVTLDGSTASSASAPDAKICTRLSPDQACSWSAVSVTGTTSIFDSQVLFRDFSLIRTGND